MYSKLTWQGIDNYFTFKHVPGIGKQFRPLHGKPSEDSFETASKKLRTLLYDAAHDLVEKHVGDFHILLSGGLDSCVTLKSLRMATGRKIVSHTLNYTGTWAGKNTDLEYARLLSEAYNTEHHEHIVTADEMRRDFPIIVKLLKYPFAGFVSPYFAAKMLKGVDAVFTGDLSDELFGSYKGPREASLMTKASYSEILRWRASLDAWCVFSVQDKSKLYTHKLLSQVDTETSEQLLHSWMPECRDNVNRMIGLDWVSAGPDQVFYSPSVLMDQADLSPFMSERVIDYVATLPGEYKVLDGNVKRILKEAFRGHIQNYVIERPKEGFVQPSNYWLFNNWQKWAYEVLSRNCLEEHGLLDCDYVHDLLDEYYAGNQNLQYKVWTVFCFQQWWNHGERLWSI